MVCSAEIRTAVTKLLALHKSPPTTSSWADHLYTCTYRLPTGKLVFSVKESPDPTSAHRYFSAQGQHLGATRLLAGMYNLGMPAYQTDGNAIFLKDNKTLQVDATALPHHHTGPANDPRTDIAYTLATDVLACWSGK
ncbi:hypothetical protein [Actinoallomurus bryophytorum]|nr:hypothetical protein [Actinoallomurus bryophytorum]